MAGECPGATLERRGRIRRQERSIGDEHPIVIQAVGATIRPIPDDNRTDCRRCAQIQLPPGIRIGVGMSHRAAEETAIRVAVDRRTGTCGGVSGQRAALRRRPAHRDIRGRRGSPEHLHFRQAQIVRASELHAHVTALRTHRDRGGWSRRAGLMAARTSRRDSVASRAYPSEGTECRRRTPNNRSGGKRNRCRCDSRPRCELTVAEASQIHLPPGIRIGIRVSHRAIEEVAIGITVHGRARGVSRITRQRAALRGRPALRQIGGRWSNSRCRSPGLRPDSDCWCPRVARAHTGLACRPGS